MYYKQHYIETNGKVFRVYKRGFIFRKYLGWYPAGVFTKDEFETLAESKEAIDDAMKDRRKFELVEPLDGCSQI